MKLIKQYRLSGVLCHISKASVGIIE